MGIYTDINMSISIAMQLFHRKYRYNNCKQTVLGESTINTIFINHYYFCQRWRFSIKSRQISRWISQNDHVVPASLASKPLTITSLMDGFSSSTWNEFTAFNDRVILRNGVTNNWVVSCLVGIPFTENILYMYIHQKLSITNKSILGTHWYPISTHWYLYIPSHHPGARPCLGGLSQQLALPFRFGARLLTGPR